MSFKSVSKSRSMVLKKGKVVDIFRFSISGTIIPSILEQPVKSMGKCFDSSLRWMAEKVVEVAESRLWQKMLVGAMARLSASLGCFSKTCVPVDGVSHTGGTDLCVQVFFRPQYRGFCPS